MFATRVRELRVSGEVKGRRHACFIFPRLASQSQRQREIVHQIGKSKEERKMVQRGKKGKKSVQIRGEKTSDVIFVLVVDPAQGERVSGDNAYTKGEDQGVDALLVDFLDGLPESLKKGEDGVREGGEEERRREKEGSTHSSTFLGSSNLVEREEEASQRTGREGGGEKRTSCRGCRCSA